MFRFSVSTYFQAFEMSKCHKINKKCSIYPIVQSEHSNSPDIEFISTEMRSKKFQIKKKLIGFIYKFPNSLFMIINDVFKNLGKKK